MKVGVQFENVLVIPTFIVKSKENLKNVFEPFSIENVSVDYDVKKYARKESKLINQTEVIESTWRKRTENNPRIYNASKFRLAGIHLDGASNKLELKVGLTSYKEILGTHYSDVTKELQDEAKAATKNDSTSKDGIFTEFAFMSNAIGVGAICVTKDKFVVLMLRANWTGEFPGKIDRPGGHPEPLEALKSQEENESGGPAKTVEENGDFEDLYKELTQKEVLQEIFASPQKELRDEINIELEAQEDPKLLGEILMLERGGRVGLDFLIKVNLSKKEVLERYTKGHQLEADESTALMFVPVEEIEKWEFEESFIKRLTEHCLGGLRLFHILLNSQRN